MAYSREQPITMSEGEQKKIKNEMRSMTEDQCESYFRWMIANRDELAARNVVWGDFIDDSIDVVRWVDECSSVAHSFTSIRIRSMGGLGALSACYEAAQAGRELYLEFKKVKKTYRAALNKGDLMLAGQIEFFLKRIGVTAVRDIETKSYFLAPNYDDSHNGTGCIFLIALQDRCADDVAYQRQETSAIHRLLLQRTERRNYPIDGSFWQHLVPADSDNQSDGIFCVIEKAFRKMLLMTTSNNSDYPEHGTVQHKHIKKALESLAKSRGKYNVNLEDEMNEISERIAFLDNRDGSVAERIKSVAPYHASSFKGFGVEK